MDSFYIGNLKGVGKVYQLTAVDVATRWAIMLIVIGPPTAGCGCSLTGYSAGAASPVRRTPSCGAWRIQIRRLDGRLSRRWAACL